MGLPVSPGRQLSLELTLASCSLMSGVYDTVDVSLSDGLRGIGYTSNMSLFRCIEMGVGIIGAGARAPKNVPDTYFEMAQGTADMLLLSIRRERLIESNRTGEREKPVISVRSASCIHIGYYPLAVLLLGRVEWRAGPFF